MCGGNFEGRCAVFCVWLRGRHAIVAVVAVVVDVVVVDVVDVVVVVGRNTRNFLDLILC